MTSRNALRRAVPPGELPDFAPVPRRSPRHDGWTVERQRAFIEALADTGCVAVAARMVNMSKDGAYQLRRQPGAQSFRAAWEAAQSLGLQQVKDEAFHRALHGELVPVFAAGQLMGFRRKKNDRLLMFILRHYGQDSAGRKTTINYFSTRATAGAGAAAATQDPPRDGEGDRAQRGGGGPETRAESAAEASTTTVKTIISQPPVPSPQSRDTQAAATLDAFEGAPLDAEAQAEIYRALEACAERRRALEADPENDPDCAFVAIEDAPHSFLGALESGYEEEDEIEFRSGDCPEAPQSEAGGRGRSREHRWEALGEGGNAAEIDRIVAEIEQRRAARTPDEIAAEEAEEEAKRQRLREAGDKTLAAPALPKLSADDPELDWRNWTDGGYRAPANPPRNGGEERRMSGGHPSTAGRSLGDRPKGGGGAEAPNLVERVKAMDGPVPELSPNPQAPPPKPRKRSPEQGRRTYKKREPKSPFTAPDEDRKAEAVAAVVAERRLLAADEAERRKRRRL